MNPCCQQKSRQRRHACENHIQELCRENVRCPKFHCGRDGRLHSEYSLIRSSTLEYARVRWSMLECARVRSSMLEYSSTLEYARECSSTLEYA